MVFWCRIRHSKLQSLLSHHCQRFLFHSQKQRATIFARVCETQQILLLPCRRPIDLYTTVRFFAAPVQAKPKPEKKDSKAPRLNQQITADIVRLVSDEGHEVVSRREALERAKGLKLDLVEVQRDAKPPVCKIMDFHREKYKKQTEQKEKVKSKLEIRRGDCKEIRFTTKIDEKDLQMKADTVKRLMEKGYRVKVMATGKEDQDLGGLLSRLSAKIEDVAIVESGPMVERLQAYAIVRHVKFGPSKKGAAKKFTILKAEVPEAVASSPTIDSSCSTHSPQLVEDDLEPTDSCSEFEDDIIPEQTKTPSKSPIRMIDGKLDKMVWSAFGVSDDVKEGLDFDGCKSGDGNGALPRSLPERAHIDSRNQRSEFPSMQNRIPRNPQGSTGSERTGLQFPNQGSQPREPMGAGRSTERVYNAPRTERPRYPSMQSQHADSPQGSTGSVRVESQYPEQGRQPREPLNARTPLVHNRHPDSPQGSTSSVREGYQFSNQGRQPREPTRAGIPSREQKQTGDDSSALRNLRQHPNNSRKQESPHMVTTPASPPSSYGIFSSIPKPTIPCKQSTNTVVDSSDTKRNPSGNPAESRQRVETDETSRGAWGIFSKDSSNGKQINFDSQIKVKR